jgi:hypothetical protein
MTYSPREQGHPTMNATRARQGRWGRHVFWVLVFSTVLTILGFVLAWSWRDAEHPGQPGSGQETISGKAYDTPAPPTPARQAPEPQTQP